MIHFTYIIHIHSLAIFTLQMVSICLLCLFLECLAGGVRLTSLEAHVHPGTSVSACNITLSQSPITKSPTRQNLTVIFIFFWFYCPTLVFLCLSLQWIWWNMASSWLLWKQTKCIWWLSARGNIPNPAKVYITRKVWLLSWLADLFHGCSNRWPF